MRNMSLKTCPMSFALRSIVGYSNLLKFNSGMKCNATFVLIQKTRESTLICSLFFDTNGTETCDKLEPLIVHASNNNTKRFKRV